MFSPDDHADYLAKSDYLQELKDHIRRGRELVALQHDIVAKMKGWGSRDPCHEEHLVAFRRTQALLEDHFRDMTRGTGAWRDESLWLFAA